MTCTCGTKHSAGQLGSFSYRDSLEYTAPSTGGWGLVHILAMVPQMHILFVVPPACGRHTALGSVQQGIKQRVSYYFLTMDEIVSGYDQEILSAVAELLKHLRPKPKAIALIVSCLDDLIGTDENNILRILRERYTELDFMFGRMNPISANTSSPPMITCLQAMLGLLHPCAKQDKDEAWNLLGNFSVIPKSNELFALVNTLSATVVRDFSGCKDYQNFQKMARSRLNLVMGAPCLPVAASLKKRLQIDFLDMIPSYRLETIAAQYECLQNYCAEHAPQKSDLEAWQAILEKAKLKAKRAIAEAKLRIAARPIWLTGGSLSRPFETALALLEYGFNVEALVVQAIAPYEQAAAQELKEKHPHLRYLQMQHFETANTGALAPEILAVGFDAAYQAGASRVLPLLHDDGMFGYDGIVRLMEGMSDAVDHPVNLQELIRSYGLII